MKFLLVNPRFPVTFWGFKYAIAFNNKLSAFPPLGLLTVASLVPKEWECRLVDCEIEELKDSDIDWADIVGVTGMLIQKKDVHQVVNRCKARRKKVMVGGPYVSTSMEDVPQADYIFVGEAEETLPEFVRDLASGTTKKFYKAAERPQLALTPVPDFGLVDLKAYSSMSVQFSRGCPFDCEFCDIIEIFGRIPRTKSNAQMLAELDALFALGWRGPVFAVDDNFIGNKKNVRLLMPDLIAWQTKNGYPFSFFTEASVNLADDPSLLAEMQTAGFNKVFLGIETPVEASLKESQKIQNTRRNLLDSVRTIQDYGLEVMAGFIVGFDNDPEDIFQRMKDFIKESKIPLAMVGLLTALPDTQLWKRLKLEGRLLTESIGNNTDGEGLNFVPKMDAEKLIAGYRSIVQAIYSPRIYYQRALECLGSLPPPKNKTSNLSLINGAGALMRVAFTLGVLDPERREFWRFIAKAALEHRERFAQAVNLAAMGYHFRRLGYN